jgi:hypothetical protein
MMPHRVPLTSQGKPVIQGDTWEWVWALKDVSFEIRHGETVGVLSVRKTVKARPDPQSPLIHKYSQYSARSIKRYLNTNLLREQDLKLCALNSKAI